VLDAPGAALHFSGKEEQAMSRIAIITGGAQGIGAAAARRFKAEGFRGVVLVDRNAEGLEKTSKTLGGKNFGWRWYEGNHRYVQPTGADSTTMAFPLHEYPGYSYNGGIGCSVIGGFVYRGSQFSAMYGHYIYADYVTGKFWALRRNPTGPYQNVAQSITLDSPVTFGEDSAGELYVASFYGGAIYKVTAQACPSLVTLTTFDPITGSALIKSSHSINASNLITPTASVTYSAQNSIEFQPGFRTTSGSIFQTKIGSCPNNP
jgi:hypothetical protein